MYKWVRDRSVSGIALSFSVERRLGVCLVTNREGNFHGQRHRTVINLTLDGYAFM